LGEGLGFWHLGPRAQPAEGVAIEANSTGDVAAIVLLVRTSINDTNRRIGQAIGEPIGLGQQLRMSVSALTNRNRDD